MRTRAGCPEGRRIGRYRTGESGHSSRRAEVSRNALMRHTERRRAARSRTRLPDAAGRRPSGWWALRVEVPAPLVTPGSGSRRPPRSRRGVSVASRPPNRPGLAIRPRAQPARDYRSPITTHAIVGSASDEYRSQRAPNVAADQTVAAACVTQILGRKSISGASAHRPRAGGRSHVCRGARASVIVPSERQGPVVDDLFHDQRGGDALNAG
jgi:hypothetical protein